jgi:hypothetical protein
MKILKQLRYILFAVMVLGCFANFAQNEYGLNMVYYSELFLGFTFFIEAFIHLKINYKATRARAIYLFTEHFFLGCILTAYFLTSKDIMLYGRLLGFFAAVLLLIQYLIYAIKSLFKKTEKGVLLRILVFLFIITILLAINGLTWKLNHWPYSNLLMKYSFFGAVLILLAGLLKRNYTYDGETISLKERLNRLPGKMVFAFCYFTIWTTYITLIIWGVVPGFYQLSVPPAQEKMKQERNPAADVYWENYTNFLDNRHLAEEKN